MSKRTDTIRSLFTAPQAETLSADNNAAFRPKVSPGSVRSMKDSLTGIERENDALREALAGGAAILDIDPTLIDPSPVADRFADVDDPSLEALKASIKANGQEVPILVRQHPASPGRYQVAYGHRRVRVLRELGQLVKAAIRTLSDQDLVIAQGIENSARQDLSFIERAVFAMRLEDAGHDRSVIQEALSVDRAEASKLVSVARTIPDDLIAAIGRAPKVGRGRWQALADAAKNLDSIKRMRAAIRNPGFNENDSDTRFLVLLSASNSEVEVRKEPNWTVATISGHQVARVTQSENEVKILIDRKADAGFAAYLINQLPGLFETFQQTSPEDRREE
ncbi:plasmid partitioning protein RepB [Methylocapsa acidiphila]|uniref:plasmid partitioning protein RepB n=1 Tax=Methylocapsa acidiphila TaxID=133552 RepID=UPI00047E4F94|nr:plasmid partitioning protein RepB [Methylocapsa acidiphila]